MAEGTPGDMERGAYVRLLSALYASTFLVRVSFGVSIVTLGTYVQASQFTYGLVVSSAPLFELLTVLGLGVFIDRHGRKDVLLASLGLAAAALFGISLTRNPALIWGVSAFQGVAAAGILVTSLALIADYAQDSNRGREMGAFDFTNLFGWLAGFSVGFALHGLFPTQGAIPFRVAALLALGGLVYAFFTVTEPHREHHVMANVDARTILAVVRERDVLLLTAPWFIVFVFAGSILAFMSRTLTGTLNFNTFLTAGAMLGGGTVFLVSQVVYGKLSDRFGRTPLMLVGALGFVGLMTTVGYGLITAPAGADARSLFDHLLGHWGFLGIFLLAALAFGPSALAALADFSQKRPKGITMSVYSLVLSLGMIVGPPSVGLLSDTVGNVGIVVWFILLSFLMLGLVVYRAWILGYRPGRRPAEDPRATADAGGEEP